MKFNVEGVEFLNDSEWSVLNCIYHLTSDVTSVGGTRIKKQLKTSVKDVSSVLSELVKQKLVTAISLRNEFHYCLSFKGLDYLAVKALIKTCELTSVGRQIATGKEAEVYLCKKNSEKVVLKVFRLGRTCFRNSVHQREYALDNHKRTSWMSASCNSAEHEYETLQKLYNLGFAVPQPLGYAKHILLIKYYDYPLLAKIGDQPKDIICELLDHILNLVYNLATIGYVHGDLNEFNLLCAVDASSRNLDTPVILLDFTQYVNITDANAEEIFNRDIQYIITFFEKRYRVTVDTVPAFTDVFNTYQANINSVLIKNKQTDE